MNCFISLSITTIFFSYFTVLCSNQVLILKICCLSKKKNCINHAPRFLPVIIIQSISFVVFSLQHLPCLATMFIHQSVFPSSAHTRIKCVNQVMTQMVGKNEKRWKIPFCTQTMSHCTFSHGLPCGIAAITRHHVHIQCSYLSTDVCSFFSSFVLPQLKAMCMRAIWQW